MKVAHGDQILACATAVDRLGPGVPRTFLGVQRLRDLNEADAVYQLSIGGFPPIRSLDLSLRRRRDRSLGPCWCPG